MIQYESYLRREAKVTYQGLRASGQERRRNGRRLRDDKCGDEKQDSGARRRNDEQQRRGGSANDRGIKPAKSAASEVVLWSAGEEKRNATRPGGAEVGVVQKKRGVTKERGQSR